MNNLSLTYNIRSIGSIGLLVILLWMFPQTTRSQQKEHTFKITRYRIEQVPAFLMGNHLTLVNIVAEYDPLSADHLYITEFDLDNMPVVKNCYLFKGKKFNIQQGELYIDNGELVKDGAHKTYVGDGILESEKIYKQGVLQQQSSFYTNGQKYMMISGDEKFLNGPFKIWHPSGQLIFSGNYRDNLKEGVFESFDASGKAERKGLYHQGKLMEGDAVVQDLIYDAPEVPAQYKGNDSILNKILIKKTASLAEVVTMDSTVHKVLDLKFTIHKTGLIKKVDIANSSDPLDAENIQAVFSKQFMNFQPALIEGVPVSSYFSKSFYLTNKGLTATIQGKDSLFYDDNVYTIVKDMPEYPGGETALRKFLATTIRYPKEATAQNLQGKVFVGFVVMKAGTISNVSLVRGVHPLLDAEALRVVKQMPKWTPGRLNGKPVKVSYTIPLNFVLE